MNKKRPSSIKGAAIDGFIPRQHGRQTRHAVSGNSGKSKRSPRKLDGFVPRQPSRSSRKPLDFNAKSQNVKTSQSIPSPTDSDTITLTDNDIEKALKSSDSVHSSNLGFWKKRKLNNKKPKPSKRSTIKKLSYAVIIIFILVGGYLGFKFIQATGSIFDGNVLGFFDNTKLRGEDEGRVNILLAGTSEDDDDHGGADLTDSIMIASIDTKNNTGFMLSVPRDLWVEYGEACSAGYEGKINVAYQCGNDVSFNESGYFKGGMGLLQKIITSNFGIPIHYYGKINYTAFKDAVEAVGGIDITIKTDDPRGIMDRNFDWMCRYQCYKVRYPNGPVHLDGESALLLARSRGASGDNYGTGNDFGRTERQRDMLAALKSKALSAGVISNPAKISDLLDAAKDNVETNFKSNEVRRLYDVVKQLDDKKITSIDLVDDNHPLVTTGNYSGQSIVLPLAGMHNFTEIELFFKKLISNDPVAREGAKVVVLNASSSVGLAQKKADALSKKGIDVVSVGNASEGSKSVIVDISNGNKSSTKKILQEIFGLRATSSFNDIEEVNLYSDQADFIIIIGSESIEG